MGLSTFNLLGHHTGGLVAFEVAAKNPERVNKLIISAAPFADLEYREKHKDGDGVDDAVMGTTWCETISPEFSRTVASAPDASESEALFQTCRPSSG